MSKLNEWLLNLVVRHPKKCFVISLFFFFALAPGLGLLKEEYDIRQWLEKSNPLRKQLKELETRFGSEDSLVIAVHNENGIFNLETAKTLDDMTREAWKLPMVIKVESLINYNYIHTKGDDIAITPFLERSEFPSDPSDKERAEEYFSLKKKVALEHSVLPGYLVSKDTKTALIFARLAPQKTTSKKSYHTLLEKANELAEKYRGQKLLIHLGGGPWIVYTTTEKIVRQESKIVLPCFLAIIFFYLFFLFRSPLASVLPVVLAVMTTSMTLGLACYFGVKFYSIFELLPGVMITLSVADSVHLFMYYYQFRGMGKDNREALRAALRKNFLPSFLTTVSTMIGFLSLSLSDVIPIKYFGLLGSLGCFIAWILTIFTIGPIIFWINPKIPKYFTQGHEDDHSSEKGEWAAKSCAWIERHRLKIVFISLGAMGILTFSTLKNETNANPYLDFKEHVPIRITQDFLLKHFGNTGPEIVIDSGQKDGIKDPKFLSKVDAFKNWLEQQSYIEKTVDAVNIVKNMNSHFHGGKEEFYEIPPKQKTVAELLFLYTMSLPMGSDINNRISTDYRSMRMSLFWKFEKSKDWIDYTHVISQKAKELGLPITLTGQIDLAHRLAGHFVSAFINSIIMIPLFVTILLLLVFRSIKMGILSIFANFFPLVVGGGLMYLGDMALSAGTVLVAAVCLGVTVDDTIHFILGYYRRRYQEGLEIKEAIRKTFKYTTSSLMTTTFILVAGFSLYIPSDLLIVSKFGILCCVVLTSALLGDTILLPALLFIFERKKKERVSS